VRGGGTTPKRGKLLAQKPGGRKIATSTQTRKERREQKDKVREKGDERLSRATNTQKRGKKGRGKRKQGQGKDDRKNTLALERGSKSAGRGKERDKSVLVPPQQGLKLRGHGQGGSGEKKARDSVFGVISRKDKGDERGRPGGTVA